MSDTANFNRREFLTASAAVGVSTLAGTYARAAGANDRIGVALIGCGGRGPGLLHKMMKESTEQIQVVGLCDVWKPNLQRTADMVRKTVGYVPEVQSSRYQEILNSPQIDAVMIATTDFSHTPILIDAIKAGKDVYVEKPMSITIEEANTALDLARQSDRVIQVGTQRRSEADFRNTARFVQSGALGQVVKVETAWNRNYEAWWRPTDDVKQADVDWEAYLLNKPKIPFDPARLRRWHLYNEYTTGTVGLLGCHLIDVGAWAMDDPYPESCACLGGTYFWTRDRQQSDTSETVWKYPSGFIMTFSCRLASRDRHETLTKFHGHEHVLELPSFGIRSAAHVKPDQYTPPVFPKTEEGESHTQNWLDCIRSRKTPNAPIEAGHQHSVACILAYQSELQGKVLRYDKAKRQIVEA